MAKELNAITLRYPHFESILGETLELSDGSILHVHEADHDLSQKESESYDVWEIPIVRYMAGRELGLGWTAIPVFATRRFIQWMIDVAEDSDLHDASELNGKRLAQRYHRFTDAVWAKGVIEQDYGVDPKSVSWFTLHAERLAGTSIPDNVTCLDNEDSAQLLRDGVVDAILDQGYALPPPPGVRRLWADPESAAEDWYKKVNVFPILHVIAVKDPVLAEHPSLAHDLYEIFDKAKSDALEKWDYGATLPEDRAQAAIQSGFPGSSWASNRSFLDRDPIPYGVKLKANRESLERVIRYAYESRAIENHYSIEDIFAPVD